MGCSFGCFILFEVASLVAQTLSRSVSVEIVAGRANVIFLFLLLLLVLVIETTALDEEEKEEEEDFWLRLCRAAPYRRLAVGRRAINPGHRILPTLADHSS